MGVVLSTSEVHGEEATVPGPPTHVRALTGDGRATISWSPPTNDGGSRVVAYRVSSQPPTVTATIPETTSLIFPGLHNGTEYVFTVRAVNDLGDGPPSPPSNAITPTAAAAVPGAPLHVVATAGNGEATVSWTAAAGATATTYTVVSVPRTHRVKTSGATSVVFPGLADGVTYRFTVHGSNEFGDGTESVLSNEVIPTSPGHFLWAYLEALRHVPSAVVLWVMAMLLLSSEAVRRRYAGATPWVQRALFVAGLSAALAWAWHLRSLFDDAYISLRYARNFASGWGLVFNLGERVEGYTNFLWTMVFAAGIALGLDGPRVALFGCLAAFAAELLLIVRLSRLMSPGRTPTVPLAAVLLGSSYAFATYGTTGMETMFATLLMTAALERALLGYLGAAGFLGILSVMAHPDHSVLYAGLGLALAFDTGARRQLWRYGAAFVLLYLPYFAWRWHYYGDFFPNTYYTKNGDLTYWRQGLTYLAVCGLGTGLVTMAPVIAYALWRHRRELLARYALFALVPYLVYVAKIGGDFMYARLIIPVLAVAALLAEQGLADLVTRRRPARWLAAGLLGLAAVPVYLIPPREFRWYIADERTLYSISDVWPEIIHDDVRLQERAQALKAIAEVDSSLLVAELNIGLTGWESNLRMVDILGLTDRTLAHRPTAERGRPGHEKLADPSYLFSRHVDLSFEALYSPHHEIQTLVAVGNTPFYLRQYDPRIVSLLKQVPGSRGPDMGAMIDEYIRQARLVRPAELEDDIQFFEQFYFSANPDPRRQFQLAGLRGKPT